VSGKRARTDVQEFERNLMTNIILLHRELATKTYSHSSYQAFKISDPKPRDIHKASVRDRLLHHALHRTLSPFFTKTFISDSFSCREGKGTHKALDRFKEFSYKVSKNYTETAWVLKCDIRKFFATINQAKLLEIISSYISDKDIVNLLSKIISSFYSTEKGVGLPLGNLTSQLLVNIYMNEFDQFVKYKLKIKYYIRYADDFVFMSANKRELEELLPKISSFLSDKLHLQLHPHKVFIKTLASGVDFLGWIHFPNHRVLRTSTKRRMFKNLKINKTKPETVQSYLGLLKHGNTHKLKNEINKFMT
jgi:retron-type reverse transcriptase